MPRKPLVRSNERPYHIVARCNNKEWYNLPLSKIWEIYSSCICEVNEKQGFETLAFVLMNNHFHWIVRTPKNDIDVGMRLFMLNSSLKIGKQAGRINRIYGSRCKPSIILTDDYLWAAIKYVYRNPVKAGVCKNIEEYPWSTFHTKSGISIVKDYEVNSDENLLSWLNEAPEEKFEQEFSKALKKVVLKLARDPHTKRKLACDVPIFQRI